MLSQKSSFKGLLLPIGIIILLVLLMMGRYLRYGVPHEFLSGEFKGTFEGDYDFTLELVEGFKRLSLIPSWSKTFSGPIGVFASNFHVFGQALLYFFTHNLGLSIKIYQVVYFILAGISMFALANYIYKYLVVALSCAILYIFTPFFIAEMLGYLHYTTTYFCMPLAYLFIFKALDSPRHVYYSLISSLFIAFNLLAHPQNVFIGGFFYVLFALGILLFNRTKFMKTVKIFSLIGIVVILLSLFYLLPTLFNGYPFIRSLEKTDTHTYYHSQSLLSAITLWHWPWFITPLKAAQYPPAVFMFIYALPFILVIAGLFWGLEKQNKSRLLLFLFLGVISLWLSLGTKLRFLSLFSWASSSIPFFHMARAPYRYFYQGVLTICLLSGAVFSRLPKKLSPVLSLLVILPYLYAANYYGNNYNWTFIPSEEPKYFSLVQDWLKHNNSSQHRIIETCGIPTYLGINQRMFPNGLDLLNRNIFKDYLDKFLALFGFKYVLAPRLHSQRSSTFDRWGYSPPRADDGFEDLQDYEEYYSALTTEYRFVYERLKNDPNFSFFTADTKDVAIFENKSAFDNYRIYPARGLMVLGGINAYDFLDLDRFDTKIAPIFIAQRNNLKQILKIKEVSRDLILHNTDLVDLFFLLNQKYLIFLSSLKHSGWDLFSSSYGIQQPLPYQDHSLGNFILGDLSFSDFSIITARKGNYCDIPFKIERKDNYIIILRIYGGENNSNLSVHLNGENLAQLNTKQFRGLRWVQLGTGNLEAGNYVLRLTVEEDKPVCLDTVSVISDSEFKEGMVAIQNDFESIFMTYIINKQNILRLANSAQTDLYIGKSQDYDITCRLFSVSGGRSEGKIELKIDTKPISSINYSLIQGIPANINLNNIFISQGRRSIAIENLPSDIQLEFISIAEKNNTKNNSLHNEVKIEYKHNNLNGYQGVIKTDKPLVLVHTETNYPGWKLKIGRKTIQPIITNMFLNGFIIDKTGDIKFSLFYLNFWQSIGRIISFVTLISIIIFLWNGTFSQRNHR